MTTTAAPNVAAAGSAANPLEQFNWSPQPDAERLLMRLLDDVLSRNSAARALKSAMHDVAGTRLFDWLDSIHVHDTPTIRAELATTGFVPDRDRSGPIEGVVVHPGAMFPRVRLSTEAGSAIYVKVDSVADYIAAHRLEGTCIEGQPLGLTRRARISVENEAGLWVIERHGYKGFDVPVVSPREAAHVLMHAEIFRLRRRDFADDAEGFAHANKLIDAAIADLGVDRTCDLWFEAERRFWMARNRAAQVQYARQNRLGLGWANHDHHTYRCSRRNFVSLIAVWEKLGFVCRERYHAGAQAGWGAQILEQPITGIITFNDVDLAPEELFADFAHEPLPPRDQLATVGLWCALHGDSFLQAGMHHLECMFDFDSLRTQLESEASIKMMKPFTDFPHLRQAFTEGERWKVNPDRLSALLERGQINQEQATQFRQSGALGSHLENLERNAGFKGFNQKGVSEIIAATDARKHA